MPQITADESCSRGPPASAADAPGASAASTGCGVLDAKEIARRDLATRTCLRLFPNQQVLQAACTDGCRSYGAGDGQECAFTYARTIREVAVEKPHPPTPFGLYVFASAILCVIGVWAVMRNRRNKG